MRHLIIKEAVKKFDRIFEAEESGIRPVHRKREWKRAERRLEKEKKRGGSWHKGGEGQITAPLILDPTAGGLSQAIRTACEHFDKATGIKVALKLRAGMSVKSDAKSEPLRKKECVRIDCFCCSRGNPGGCERNSSGYRIVCCTCESEGKLSHYEGETGRNPYSRVVEHISDLKNKKEDSPLWKHCVLQHNSVIQQFYMKTLSSYNSCLQRQTNEAVRITNSKATTLMNSKSEFHQAPIMRVAVFRGMELEQGEERRPGGSSWSRGRGGG